MKNSNKYFNRVITIFHVTGLLISVAILLIKDYNNLVNLFLNLIGLQIFIFVFFSLPTLILFLNYKKFNKKIKLTIDLKEEKIIISKSENNDLRIINFNDIYKIYKIESYNKSFIHIGYMDYFYYEIILQNGKSEIITCLINEDLDKYIHKDKIKKVSKFYPYIKYSEHE